MKGRTAWNGHPSDGQVVAFLVAATPPLIRPSGTFSPRGEKATIAAPASY